MRYVGSAIVALSLLVSSTLFGQNLSITNYQLVSEQVLTPTSSQMTYRADLVNTGGALGTVTASVSSLDYINLRPVPAHDTLTFAPVPANSHVTSNNTFTLQVNKSVPIDFTQLQWSFQSTPAGPMANAGPNQTVKVGSTVTLDGGGSTNPSGIGTLTYSWQFVSYPGLRPALFFTDSVKPTFTANDPGTYVLNLTVTNGSASSTSTVTVSTLNSPPVANAGPKQVVGVGSTAVLNGGASTSVDGRPLKYAWTLVSIPPGSTATLAGADTVSPTFVVDKKGIYQAQLIVNDGLPSTPSTVIISTSTPVPPVANAGPAQVVNTGSVVQLNGAGSTDVNGLPLKYQWSLITLPAGSAAALSDPTAVNPTFIADRAGTYVAQLIVNNGVFSSTPATVTITTSPQGTPTANAGVNQTVNLGSSVTLHGSGTDPQNLPLTFQWSLISKPAGSTASLSSTTVPNPVFVADVAGTYIAQLIVNNGSLSSPPSTVTISTTCAPPTANPGPNQNVATGALVTLDGSQSGDACQDPLTYTWSFLSHPPNSIATLSGANTATPSFGADVEGVYVLQLIVDNGVSDSLPATVTVMASSASGKILFLPSLLNLSTSAGVTNLLLPNLAGSGGQVVNLVSSDPTIATVPPTVTVSGGALTAQVLVTPGTKSGTVTITALAPGMGSGTFTVNVSLRTITVALDSGVVGIGKNVNGTVTLSLPTPTGTVVTLTANPGGFATVQPSVIIPAGGTVGSFTATGVALGSTTITGSSPSYTDGSASLTVGQFGFIKLPAGVTIAPNQSAPFQVTLVPAAPPGGVTVSLVSSDPTKVTVSPSVFIPSLSTTALVQPIVTGVGLGSATISASATGFAGDSQVVQVGLALSFASGQTIFVSGTDTLTLNLSSPAPPGGLTVNLSSSDPSKATVLPTATFPAGLSTVKIPVTGVAAGSAVIHASLLPNIADTAANVTVLSFGQIILPPNATVGVGQSVVFPVMVSASAPIVGVTVTLTSSDPTKVSVTPSSVFIPAGSTAAVPQPKLTGLAAGPVTITASGPGFVSASSLVNATTSLTFTPGSLTLSPGVIQNLTLNLSGAAPVGGLSINLSSANPSIASVPPTVAFGPGGTTVSVPVTGVGSGSTLIHASALPSIPDVTAAVTVQAAGAIGLPASLTLTSGQVAVLPVTLSAAAPAGGVTVTLASSDTSKVSVSSSTVFIPQGATTPAIQPQVTGKNPGSATITASSSGWTAAIVNVLVSSSPIILPNVILAPGDSVSYPVTLASPAPPGGIFMTLSSSDTSIATVSRAGVFIPEGATSSSLTTINGVSAGTATITASAFGYPSATGQVVVTTGARATLASQTARQSLSVESSGSSAKARPETINRSELRRRRADVSSPISLPNMTVPPGESVSYPVTLASPAPPGGVFLTLTSSDTSIVTLSRASVFIPQGETTSSLPTVNGINNGAATITASAFGYPSANGQVLVSTVVGPPPLSIRVPAMTSVSLGQSTAFAVTLGAPATSTVTLTLVSSDPLKVTAPASISIAAGATAPATQPQVSGASLGSASVTVSASGYPSASGTVTVVPVAALGMNFAGSPLSLTAGSLGNLTLNLTGGQAPAGLTVTLSSSDATKASVPSSVTFATGATSVPVPVTGIAAGSVTLTAGASGIPSTTATVNVSAAVSGIILPASVTVQPGQSASFPVTLGTPAAGGGVFLALSSSDSSKVTVSPANIFIPQGATAPALTPVVNGLSLGSAMITASTFGYPTANGQVQVAAAGGGGGPTPATFSFSPGSLSISVAGTQNLTLTLSQPAPSAGLTVTLNSSNPGVATVPGTVTFQANATNVAVPVTGVAAGSTVITASAAGIPNATATVTVQQQGGGGGSTGLTLSFRQPRLILNRPATLSHTLVLSSPAPAGGLTVNLLSSDTSVATVPSSVTFAPNATSADVPVTAVGMGSSYQNPAAGWLEPNTAVIQASAPGIPTAATTATVVNSPSVILPIYDAIGRDQSVELPISLSTPAPAGGVFVSLSTDPSQFTITSSVFIPAGATTPTTLPLMTAQGDAQGGYSEVIASAKGYGYSSASLFVVVGDHITIGLPNNLSLRLGLTAPLPVVLPGPAPAGGVIIQLSSTDPSTATVTPSVFVPAGATMPLTVPLITGLKAGQALITASAPANGYNGMVQRVVVQ